ncbi:hypothetical protein [Sphingomonas sp. CFBP 13706]|uniref:hypothetical protein n=1 Tax=Sphingomonas sp. CFBP 13706 TaxID=2775314 RepID=UPI00177FD6BF|nr:hypothetical protein [Sphingomonas sp. CFBP 13706]MBD8734916.1 hypothetical protein [Sphingomonas sp. CFBP 13706]
MIFRPLPEFPGYAVSECGVVKRCAGLHRGKMRLEKILKIAPVTNMVYLINDSGQAKRNVRILAMSAWCDADSLPDYAKPRPKNRVDVAHLEFRPCPNYPGFSTSQCGLIRRDEYWKRIREKSVLQPAIIRKVSKSGQVITNARAFNAGRMVIDAWGACPSKLPENVAVPKSGDVPPVVRPFSWDRRGYCHEAGVRVRTVKQPPA